MPASEVDKNNKTALGTFPPPDSRFDHFHIDITGPLPLPKDFFYLLICPIGFAQLRIIYKLTTSSDVSIANCQSESTLNAPPQKWILEFYSSSLLNAVNCVERLRSHMQNLQALPTRPVCNPILLPTDLKTCSHIFLCQDDAVRHHAQPIYNGPFRSFEEVKRLSLSFKMAKNLLFPWVA
ncbi:hypothetical protein ACTXT7_016282 [Hymenolepis weldensis]